MGWKLEEGRLVQTIAVASGAGALSVGFIGNPTPQGKVRWIIGMGYTPSVAETQVVSFLKVTRSGHSVGLLNPVSLNLNPAFATPIEQGMELILLPSEFIEVHRVAATAGSTMTLQMEFIEADLPLYTYDEPQIVKRQSRALSTIRTQLGGGVGRGGSGGVAPMGGGGRPGGGGPAPI